MKRLDAFYAGIQRIVEQSEGRLNIAQLSTAAGLNNATIRNAIKAGSAPSHRTIEKLCSFLGMSYEEIVQAGKRIAEPVDLDADLDAMDRTSLLRAARAMRAAIRAHRDQTGHGLCWHHPDMWALLPDTPGGGQVVPDWPQFMRGCIRYRASLDRQLADAPRSERECGE